MKVKIDDSYTNHNMRILRMVLIKIMRNASERIGKELQCEQVRSLIYYYCM